ncbi:hypothetical protein DAH40_27130, partial [Escherichia coli]
MLCQTVTVTHQLPDKYEKTSAEVGNARKSAHYRPRLRHHSLLISNSLLSLYRLTFPVLSWFPTTGTYSAFN